MRLQRAGDARSDRKARQDRLLKERAKRYRVTEAELIRRSIDQALSSTAIGTPDPEAWKRLKRSMAQVRKKYGALDA